MNVAFDYAPMLARKSCSRKNIVIKASTYYCHGRICGQDRLTVVQTSKTSYKRTHGTDQVDNSLFRLDQIIWAFRSWIQIPVIPVDNVRRLCQNLSPSDTIIRLKGLLQRTYTHTVTHI